MAALYGMCCAISVWCAGSAANDTAHVAVHDTAHVAVHDTTHVAAHDTARVAVHDTAHVAVHNTAHVSVYDTERVAQHVAPKFTTLVGDLPKSLPAEKGPYLITSDIYVPAGKTVTVQAGTVFLFKNFTGIHIQGTLAVLGSADKPVIFTSENDRRFNPAASLNPNPYDWNGIFIHEDAIGSDMQNFEIAYSVYGINTLTKFVRITNGVFRDNGRANFTIEGIPQTVTAGPFSYSLSVKNAAIDGVPVKILSDPDAVKRSYLRIGGLAVFLTGCAVGAIFTVETNASQKKLNTIGSDLYTYRSSDFSSAQTSRNADAVAMVAGYALGLVGAVGFYYSFRF